MWVKLLRNSGEIGCEEECEVLSLEKLCDSLKSTETCWVKTRNYFFTLHCCQECTIIMFLFCYCNFVGVKDAIQPIVSLSHLSF